MSNGCAQAVTTQDITTNAEILFNEILSRGRQDVIATCKAGSSVFNPWYCEPDISWCVKHLNGVGCVGVYMHLPDNTTNFIVFDMDNKTGERREECDSECCSLRGVLDDLEIDHTVEKSQSGLGWHVWVFLSNPIDCSIARRFGKYVVSEAGFKCREIFPKSETLDHTGEKLGNLIRLPLWNKSSCDLSKINRVEASEIVSIASNWREDTTLAARKIVSLEANTAILSDYTLGLIENVEYIHKRWNGDATGLSDNSASGLVQCLADAFVRAYVPTDEVRLAIRIWLDKQGRSDKTDRWIDLSIAKAYAYARGTSDEVQSQATNLREVAKECVPSLIDGTKLYFGFGVKELDAAIDGLRPKQLGVAAALPGNGKSAIGMQACTENAENGFSSLFVSCEMSREELVERSIQYLTGIESDNFHLHPDKVVSAAERVSNRVFLAECKPTLRAVENTIRMHVTQKGVRYVVVDYLQLIEYSPTASEQENITKTTKLLKDLARELNIAILALAQLNRGADADKFDVPRDHTKIDPARLMPTLKNLYGSSAIDKSADIIITQLVPQKNPLLEKAFLPETILINCLKRRQGPIRGSWPLNLWFDMSQQKIKSWADQNALNSSADVQWAGSFNAFEDDLSFSSFSN